MADGESAGLVQTLIVFERVSWLSSVLPPMGSISVSTNCLDTVDAYRAPDVSGVLRWFGRVEMHVRGCMLHRHGALLQCSGGAVSLEDRRLVSPNFRCCRSHRASGQLSAPGRRVAPSVSLHRLARR